MRERAQTIAEFADEMAISEDSARRLIRAGKLRAVQVGIGGKRQALRILPEHRREFLQSASVATEPTTAALPNRKRRRARAEDFVEYYP